MKPRVPASKYKKFIEFVELLRSKNALSYFKIAPDYIFNHHESRWLQSAFLWFATPEGDDFWLSIDLDWKDKLQREQNK